MPANVESMMYVGEKPWHGIGVELDHVATAEEAIRAAGLDWGVGKYPVFAEIPAGNDFRLIQVPGKYATVRMDTNDTLGVVGEVYKPLQNREAFGFFDEVVGSNAAIYHTAGSLSGGRRIWILAKLPGRIYIKGTEDVTDKFVLLANSHDGTTGVQMHITPIRVVCQNTLNIAIRQSVKGMNLRHCPGVLDKVTNVQQALGIVGLFYSEFDEVAAFLAKKPVTASVLDEYLDELGFTTEGRQRATRGDNIRAKLIELFETGSGSDLKGVRGSMWGLMNAVVEYTDHYRGTRVTSDAANEKEARLASLWFGAGAKLKQKAWDVALAMTA